MAIDSGQAQVLANAINSLANILAKPTHESWRQAQALNSVCQYLRHIEEELTKEYPEG
jgi:hypothetical protein